MPPAAPRRLLTATVTAVLLLLSLNAHGSTAAEHVATAHSHGSQHPQPHDDGGGGAGRQRRLQQQQQADPSQSPEPESAGRREARRPKFFIYPPEDTTYLNLLKDPHNGRCANRLHHASAAVVVMAALWHGASRCRCL